MAHPSSQRALPQMRPTLTPTKTPPTYFSIPVDATGRHHPLRDRRVALARPRSRPISVRRPGPKRGRSGRRGRTAVDTRSTSRTHAAESMRWGAGRTRKNRRTDTGGATRQKIAGHEPGAPFHDQNTRGRSEKQSGDPALSRRAPSLPDYPPGLSERTMGSTSPDAADETAAVRRHPAGPARAATAQLTAALAPAPASRRRSRKP